MMATAAEQAAAIAYKDSNMTAADKAAAINYNNPAAKLLTRSNPEGLRESGKFYGSENQGALPVTPAPASADELGRESGVFYGSGNTGVLQPAPGGGNGLTGGNNTNGNKVIDSQMSDAYQRLYDEFNKLGLGALVSDAKDLLMRSTSIAAMPDALRETQAYKTRFSANDARIKAGLQALSPAAYINMEDKYQDVMKRYGLPESYYKTGLYGKQEGFEKLLANDVSNVELEDRIMTAQQRVLNANPEVRNAIMKFYGDSITDGDILAYALDPSNAVQMIKRKVAAAEIGGAALAQGLTAGVTRAEELAGFGVTKDQAQQGYVNVAEMVPRGSQLADIYNQGVYNQGTAEAEVFNTTGAAEAKAKRKKLSALETASFSGSSGVGALGRDRASNYGTTQSGFGSY